MNRNSMEINEKDLIDLFELKEKNGEKYIKEGWIDGINKNVFTDMVKYGKKNHENETSIIKCINDSTSPNPDENNKKEKLKAIFRAFSLFPIKDTKVLIIGQDPYTDKSGKADGCAFSVANNKQDASLLNIFKAVEAYKETKASGKVTLFDDIDKSKIADWNYDLKKWAANNKVLLLNTALTYQNKNLKNKHQNAWQPFIQQIIVKLLTYDSNKLAVFLWGKDAQSSFFKCINCLSNNKNSKFNLCIKSKENNKCCSIESSLETITKNIICFITSHPSNNYQSVRKGFSDDAPKHFEFCDDFLLKENDNKYIWKGLPDNNKPKL